MYRKQDFDISRYVYKTLEPWIQDGRLILRPGKKRMGLIGTVPKDTYYVFTGPYEGLHRCHYDYDILFMRFNMVPSYCQQHCWKVVAKFRNVAEMYKCWTMMDRLKIAGKVGFDPRSYTRGCYVAFCYCTNKKEGQERKLQIINLIQQNISGQPDVILKRGCTEMENKHGPSDKWSVTDYQAEVEAEVKRLIDPADWQDIDQVDWLIDQRVRGWIEQAHSISDDTWKAVYADYFSGKAEENILLFPQPLTY